MNRISPIDPQLAEGKTQELLGAVQKKMGRVPNIMRSLAASPAVLEAYLNYGGGLAGLRLSAKLREQIALHVGEINSCGYCLSAHSAVGKMQGLSSEQMTAARRGEALDPKDAAALALARSIVLERGGVRDAEMRAARAAGLDDRDIVEILGVVIQNVFTNWFVHLAGPEIDFPEVKPGLGATAQR
jgi:uncharacterized peroxidase-related enzyme